MLWKVSAMHIRKKPIDGRFEMANPKLKTADFINFQSFNFYQELMDFFFPHRNEVNLLCVYMVTLQNSKYKILINFGDLILQ